jgi:hypothetical protein
MINMRVIRLCPHTDLDGFDSGDPDCNRQLEMALDRADYPVEIDCLVAVRGQKTVGYALSCDRTLELADGCRMSVFYVPQIAASINDPDQLECAEQLLSFIINVVENRQRQNDAKNRTTRYDALLVSKTAASFDERVLQAREFIMGTISYHDGHARNRLSEDLWIRDLTADWTR